MKWGAALVLGMGLLLGGAARGEEKNTRREEARAAFERGESAAREMRFGEALERYEEAARTDPTAPFAPVARARAEDLREHSEGGFGPLATLEEVRRDPRKNRDARAIAALDEAARGFPDGPVRGEALLVAAQAYTHVLKEPDRGAAALERILADPHAERTTRTLALSEVVALHRARGDLEAARKAVSRDPELLPSLTHEVIVAVRRVWIARGCVGVLGALAALGLWGVVAAARRLGDARKVVPLVVRPGALAFAFYVGGGGAVLVRLQGGEGDPLPFLGLGLGIALTGMLARAWAVGFQGADRKRAVLRGAVAGAGVIAMAYLVLWKISGDYLTPLGL